MSFDECSGDARTGVKKWVKSNVILLPNATYYSEIAFQRQAFAVDFVKRENFSKENPEAVAG